MLGIGILITWPDLLFLIRRLGGGMPGVKRPMHCMHACMHATFAMITSSTFALNLHDGAPGREAGRRPPVIVPGHATLDNRRKPPPQRPWIRAREPTGCGFGSYAQRRALAHHKLNMSRVLVPASRAAEAARSTGLPGITFAAKPPCWGRRIACLRNVRRQCMGAQKPHMMHAHACARVARHPIARGCGTAFAPGT